MSYSEQKIIEAHIRRRALMKIEAELYNRKAGNTGRAMLAVLTCVSVVGTGNTIFGVTTFGRSFVWGGLGISLVLLGFWLYYSFRGRNAE